MRSCEEKGTRRGEGLCYIEIVSVLEKGIPFDPSPSAGVGQKLKEGSLVEEKKKKERLGQRHRSRAVNCSRTSPKKKRRSSIQEERRTFANVVREKKIKRERGKGPWARRGKRRGQKVRRGDSTNTSRDMEREQGHLAEMGCSHCHAVQLRGGEGSERTDGSRPACEQGKRVLRQEETNIVTRRKGGLSGHAKTERPGR